MKKPNTIIHKFRRGAAAVAPGDVFGNRTVLGVAFRVRWSTGSRAYVVVQCECGDIDVACVANLVSDQCKKCRSCMGIEHNASRTRKWPDTRTCRIWKAMHRRCLVDKNYAGRGIKVCERWSGGEIGFSNFVADMGGVPIE